MGRIAKEIKEEKIEGIDWSAKTWTIENVEPVMRYGNVSKYLLSMDFYKLGSAYANELIWYNSSIQRGERIKKTGEVISLFKASKVKQILECALSDQLHGSSIVLNADTEETEIEYNPEDKTLKIKGRLQLVDGNHRTLAGKKWVELYKKGKVVENPKDYEIPVILEHTSEKGSALIFSELALTPTSIPKARGSFLQVNKIENAIARRIMKESEIKGRVETISNQPKGDKIVSFSVLTSSIAKYIKPETEEKGNVIATELIKYINTIVNVFPEVLGNIDIETRKENRKKTLAGEQIFLEAFIASFTDIIGTDVEKKLKELKQKGFFDRNNELWKQNVMIGEKLINKNSTRNFVVNKVKEVLK